MASQQVGELYVQIRADIADVKTKLNQLQGNIDQAAKRMSASMRQSSQESMAAIDGLASALGLRLPHAMQSTLSGTRLMGSTMAASAVAMVAGIAAVETGLIALTVKTTEQIHEMGRLAQSTGVSIEALSGIAFVAKQVGVPLNDVARFIEKMDKSAFAAATSAHGTTNAYTRLGIAVKDSSGKMRDTTAIFADVAGRFSNMRDGVAKTALAMELFGRGGANLIPILNRGKQAMEEQLATARALGIVLTKEDQVAAEKFAESMATLHAVGGGLAIQITRELLPALQTFSDFMVNDLKDSNSDLKTLIEGFGYLTRTIVALGAATIGSLGLIGDYIKHVAADVIILAQTTAGVVLGMIAHDPQAIAAAAKEGFGTLREEGDRAEKEEKARMLRMGKTIYEAFNPTKSKSSTAAPGKDIATTPAAVSDPVLARVQARIDALGREAAGWLAISKSGTGAEQLIAEAAKKGDEEIGKLMEMARGNAAAITLVNFAKEFVKSAASVAVFGAAIKQLTADLDKEANKLAEQADLAKVTAEAFAKGGSAVAGAALNEKFAEQVALIGRLAAAQKLAAAAYGDSSTQAAQLADGVDKATAALRRAKEAQAALLSSQFDKSLGLESRSLTELTPFVNALNDAYLQNAAAVREASVQLQVHQAILAAEASGLTLTAEQIAKLTANLRSGALEQQKSADAEEAAQYSLSALYDKQIAQRERIREAIQSAGEDTLLIDAAIYNAEESLLRQWDDAALKVGNLSQKFQAFFNEVGLMGKDFGAKVFGALLRGIDDLSSKLAEFVVKGRADFKALLQGIETDILKASFQKTISTVAGKIGKALGFDFGGMLGLSKPDGSSEKPFYVKIKDAIGGLPVHGGKFPTIPIPGAKNPDEEGDGTTGIFGKMFAKLGKIMSDIFKSLEKVMTTIFKAIGSAIGGIIKFIGNLFGGGHASGGDVVPGRAYLVGERGPEPFIPKVAGTILPSSSLVGGGSGSGKSPIVVINQTIHTPDPDSFRRSSSQVAQEAAMSLRLALSRNG